MQCWAVHENISHAKWTLADCELIIPQGPPGLQGLPGEPGEFGQRVRISFWWKTIWTLLPCISSSYLDPVLHYTRRCATKYTVIKHPHTKCNVLLLQMFFLMMSNVANMNFDRTINLWTYTSVCQDWTSDFSWYHCLWGSLINRPNHSHIPWSSLPVT